ncbi:MAG: MATE family efflux transporter [Clostridia bacterium]|nr:MATE family efflux transporter [Clostridia bacterium]
MNQMVKDMTYGNSAKQILFFALPLMAGNLFQQFYNMADSMIVGRTLGTDALGAVCSTGSLNFLVIGFVTGLASGFCIPVAQFFGAKDYRNLRRSVTNMIYLAVGITALLTLLTALFTDDILRLLGTPEDIFEDAYNYIIVIFLGMAATMFYNILAGLLRALGDSRSPLIFLIIASVINIGLDFFFILVCGMGVMGAGIATVVAQAVSGLLCLIYIVKKSAVLRLQKEDWRPSLSMMKKLLYLGLPMALQFSITAVGSLILQQSVNSLGTAAVSAVGAGNKTSMMLTQPMEAMGIALATFCGQNLGAGKIDRARRGVHQGLLMIMVYVAVATIASLCFGQYLALLFVTADELAVIGDIHKLLSIVGTFYWSLGVLFVYRNAVQGLGYGVPAMAAGLFELVARAVIGIFAVPVLGFEAACYAGPLAWIAADLLLIPVFYTVIHKLKKRYPTPIKSDEKAVTSKV